MQVTDEGTPDAVIAGQIPIKYRPHVQQFLREVSKKYEIAVWGSGHPIYVHGVADELDRERRYIRWRISGFALSEDKTKDLADIGRDLRRTVMIDNNPKYMEKNFDNGIVCKEFVGQKDDSELLRLSTFLLEQVDSSVTDIRSIVKTWQN